MFDKVSLPQNIHMVGHSSAQKNIKLSKGIRPDDYNNDETVTNQNADEGDMQNLGDGSASVKTHLSGTIVVVNQDVNELNQQQGY